MDANSSGGLHTSAPPLTITQGRALAPDLARGVALLGIALANSVLYIGAEAYGARSRPLDGTPLDRTVDLLLVTLVDARWLPLFAALFGYGAVQLARRLASTGREPAEVRRAQRRRYTWVAVFGAAHVILLFGGDILAIYGILGLSLLFLMRASDRVLLVLAAVAAALGALLGSAVGWPPLGSSVRMSVPSLLVADPWEALVLRVTMWPVDFLVLALSASPRCSSASGLPDAVCWRNRPDTETCCAERQWSESS
ncbi:hypothetical protein J4H86_20885 [Spiractinospora alimapuensis]|uniref:DUF418 domain-containing protein n=1 Tax=Spiractinospora alimapuensis TaxID=2820884 RepID=UPI001F17938C|nr:hypothetical protein [Spiractinospora alimapuensis]QVQ51254.1 hypothetical protein J4H86_20885 [Spiractinospora alimapuensis]